ncbi:hypothetical protein D6789_04815 [Candidatus Woesearchaeota archaeon]|nr:MAG: hypothetical protein D6789_04815 [Candidatus Woesearchaeota archaeon]
MAVVVRAMRNTMQHILAAVLLGTLFLAACTTTPTACEGATDRGSCIVELAVEQHDDALCDTLEGNTQTWCLTDVAAAADNPAICDRITSTESREFCKRDIYIAREDVEACQTLTTGAKNDCLNDIAHATNDWLTCVSMEEGARREECIDGISRSENDPYGCLRLNKQNPRRDGCIYMTSVRSNTPATCSELQDSQLENLCFTTIATNAQTTDDCNELPERYKTFCMKQFADQNQ